MPHENFGEKNMTSHDDIFAKVDKNKATNSLPQNNGEAVSHKEMSMDALRQKIQALQSDTVQQLEASLSEMLGQFLQEVEKTGGVAERPDDSLKYRNRIKATGELSEKHFVARNSVLTDLFEVKHVRTIYNIFCVVLIIVLLHTATLQLVATGTLSLGFELITWNFSKLHLCACIWVAMKLSTFAMYFCFRTWAVNRVSLPLKSEVKKVWDWGWLTLFVMYLAVLFWAPVWYLCRWELRPALSFVVLMEQVRLVMKAHAFVRSNVPRAVAYKPHGDSDAIQFPPFSWFLYFLFAPTLIYRDSYPRTKSTDWYKVFRYLLDVVGVVFYIWFIFEYFFMPMFREFGLQPVSTETVLVWTFSAMFPATVMFLCGFYCLLHCWLNAFAEMLRFADRMFYKDWWNSTSYADYFRTWNIVVHDWLYTYVYRDVRALRKSRGGLVPTVVVFLVSALVHEYILAFTFSFFLPMLLIAFGGFAMCMAFVRRDLAGKGNLVVWLFMFCGNGLLACAYCIEWYARINCERTLDSTWDFVVPRSWTCKPQSAVVA